MAGGAWAGFESPHVDEFAELIAESLFVPVSVLGDDLLHATEWCGDFDGVSVVEDGVYQLSEVASGVGCDE